MIYSKKMRTKYGGKNCKDVVWNKAMKIPGYDPKLFRYDSYYNILYYKHYAIQQSIYGWHIDHIKPKKKGGSDDIINLQALQCKVNCSKQATLVKRSRHNQKYLK